MEFLGISLKGVEEVPCKEAIQVNVYDIHVVSRWTSTIGLGLYHTGVVVGGQEFSYGGHDNESTGIYKIPPKDCSWLGDGMQFRTTIRYGLSKRSMKEVYEYLACIGHKFRGIDYNLLCQNCNHFADQFLYFLVKRNLPAFVNRVARLFNYTLSPWIPKSWVQYPCASSNSSASSKSSASPSQASVSSSASNSKEKGKAQSKGPRRSRPPLKEIITVPKLGSKAQGHPEASSIPAEMNFLLQPSRLVSLAFCSLDTRAPEPISLFQSHADRRESAQRRCRSVQPPFERWNKAGEMRRSRSCDLSGKGRVSPSLGHSPYSA